MDYEAFLALVADGGGFNNVVRLIFDNNIHANFTTKPEEEKLKESDFVNLGGTWFYKEKSFLRGKDTFEYDVPIYMYHPMECLQGVVMSNEANRIDIMSVTDMIAQLTS